MRQCTPKGMAPKADTILDRIAEFAKMPASLKFCVRATLRPGLFDVRRTHSVSDEHRSATV